MKKLTCGLENRGKQQLQMLDPLQETQNHFETREHKGRCADLQVSESTHHMEEAPRLAKLCELQQPEVLRQEAKKSRDELNLKARNPLGGRS